MLKKEVEKIDFFGVPPVVIRCEGASSSSSVAMLNATGERVKSKPGGAAGGADDAEGGIDGAMSTTPWVKGEDSAESV